MSKPLLRLLLVDDHPVALEGLSAMLNASGEYEVVAQANSATLALAAFRDSRPDLVILDVRLPDMSGLEVARRLFSLQSDAKVLLMSTIARIEDVRAALHCGVQGFLLKTAIRQDIYGAIAALSRGDTYYQSSITNLLVSSMQLEKLTPRELDVLTLIAEGLSNKEIATKLRIGEVTVKWHVQSLLSKLGARDRTHAVTLAIRSGNLVL